MKTCTRCKATRGLSSFHKRVRASDGLNSWCKDCFSIYKKQKRAKKHEAAGTTPRIHGDAEARFMSYLSEPDENGCILWTGATNRGGYGQTSTTITGKQVMALAHRYSFELANGPIPLGSVIHHICHVRLCVNPDHLVNATNLDNIIESHLVVTLKVRVKELEKENKKLRTQLKKGSW